MSPQQRKRQQKQQQQQQKTRQDTTTEQQPDDDVGGVTPKTMKLNDFLASLNDKEQQQCRRAKKPDTAFGLWISLTSFLVLVLVYSTARLVFRAVFGLLGLSCPAAAPDTAAPAAKETTHTTTTTRWFTKSISECMSGILHLLIRDDI